jgi:glutathione S-transferase
VTSSRARLVTIPFSHFCEKARWALDRAGVPYTEEGHVPLFHRLAVRRAGSPRTSVPALVAEGRLLGDSRDILAWADAKAAAGREIYPKDPREKEEALALEATFDTELGPHLRRLLYFHLLPHRKLTFGLMDQETPRWERVLLRGVAPALLAGMRRFMRVDEAGATLSHAKVLRVLDDVDARLSDGRPFLVGDRFTSADITLAALTSPAMMPPEHRIRFPAVEALGPAAAQILREVHARPVAAYVRRMYREHRHAIGSP